MYHRNVQKTGASQNSMYLRSLIYVGLTCDPGSFSASELGMDGALFFLLRYLSLRAGFVGAPVDAR